MTGNAAPLPDDIARCTGVGSDEDGWRDGCEHCLRRTSPVTGWFGTHIEPPTVIVFSCPYWIGDDDEN